MAKDFSEKTYIVDDNLADTLTWLVTHQEAYGSFEYDSFTKVLLVHHANGTDQIKVGQYLNAKYGILITSL